MLTITQDINTLPVHLFLLQLKLIWRVIVRNSSFCSLSLMSKYTNLVWWLLPLLAALTGRRQLRVPSREALHSVNDNFQKLLFVGRRKTPIALPQSSNVYTKPSKFVEIFPNQSSVNRILIGRIKNSHFVMVGDNSRTASHDFHVTS